MSAEVDKQLYQQLGELTAEVRALRSSIETANTAHAERFTSIEERVKTVEEKVDAFDSILDRVRGATAFAKAAYVAGGVAGGGAAATLVSALVGG